MLALRSLLTCCLLHLSFLYSHAENFDLLMGRETPSWEYVQTPEDHQRMAFFRSLFDKHLLRGESTIKKIPQTIHFIWLGPENFPKQSVERVKKWVELHPDWIFKFWTDIEREPPHLCMKKCLVSDFPFGFLADPFYDSVNFGEKAKILAYEVLFKEGGIYVDHDTTPCKPLDPLHQECDFYCGLEPLAPSIVSTSVIPSTHFVGAKPGHPILKETLTWLQNCWDELEQSYPGKSIGEVTNRILHGTFWALSEGIDRGIGQEENCDVVFPVSYFSGSHRKASTHVLHHHEGKWSHSLTHFENKMHRQLEEILRKDEEAVRVILFLAGISLLGSLFLALYVRAVHRRQT